MSSNNGTVLITGASSGIGEALSWIFAEQGYDLILVARNADKLDALADELVAKHAVTASVRPADLSVAGDARALARTLQREGLSIDVLVNNAGVLQHGAFVDMDIEDQDSMINLNVAGLTELLSSFVPQLVEQGSGRVLNVASIAAFQPFPSLAIYAATKAYVLSLSEALGEELRGTGVTVTTLCPGVTETNMITQARQDSAGVNKLPAMLVGDVETVAREAFRGCMKGTPIIVPGTLNLAGTLLARSTPKWLVRRVTGLMGRSTL